MCIAADAHGDLDACGNLRGPPRTGMRMVALAESVYGELMTDPFLGIYPEGTEVTYHAHIDMKTAQGYVVPWLASQADLLADDWEGMTDAP